MIEQAIRLLHTEKASCVLIKNSEVRIFTQRGVADLYALYLTDRTFMHGAVVADKVVGKAAAALMILGGIRQVYADVVSTGAMQLFRNTSIEVRYTEEVPHIINRTRTGWCPMETRCQDLQTAEECLPQIEDFIHRLKESQQENKPIP